MTELRYAFLEKGWKQGSVIVPSQLAFLEKQHPHFFREYDWVFVVVTHSCTIVNGSLDEEPYVELVAARIVDSPNQEEMYARLPRRLSLEASKEDKDRCFLAFHARNRFFVGREELLNITPDAPIVLSSDALRILKEWLILRFTQTTLPDSFNDRLASIRSKFAKVMKQPGATAAKSLWIRLDRWDNRLPDDVAYEVELLFIYDAEEMLKQEELETPPYEQMKGRLNKIFASCQGLKLINVHVFSKSDITLDAIESWIPWNNYDYLSLKQND